MLRGDLKSIYDTLENSEKNLWAEKAGYKSREGLYSYIRVRHDKPAYQKVVDALEDVIGLDRLNEYIEKIRKSKELILEECKVNLIKCILHEKDIGKIKRTRDEINRAFENQIDRLEIEKININ